MRILSWNIRGTGRNSFLANIRHLISKYNLDILVLMETRVYSNRAQRIIRSINLLNFVEIQPEGFSCGIWLLWKNTSGFDIKVIKTHPRLIHSQIRDNNKSASWIATFLYGYHQHHLQSKLCKEISSLQVAEDIPWMIIGDLNELSSTQDKFTNSQGNSTHFNKFNNILNNITFLIFDTQDFHSPGGIVE